MASNPTGPPRVPWRDWLPVVSAAGLLMGAAFFNGGSVEKQNDALRRIAAIEVRQDQQDREHISDIDKLNKIDVRTARIETKIDVLTPTRGTAQ